MSDTETPAGAAGSRGPAGADGADGLTGAAVAARATARPGTPGRTDAADTPGAPDRRTPPGAVATVVATVVAAVAGGAATLVLWYLLKTTHFPSFNASFVSKALATATLCVVVVVTAGLLHLRAHPTWRPATDRGRRVLRAVTEAAAHLAPAGLVVGALGLPLSASRLYLGGISVDQAFRTQFLTRMADTPGYADMAYPGQPSFYPGLWFFTGGLFSRVTGLAGWAVFQPWALVTLAAAGCALVPVWRRITGSFTVATAAATVTTAVVLFIAPGEPYAAVVGMGVPAALVLGRRGLHGGRFALLGVTVFLGLSANLYTLFTGVTALTLIAMALAAAVGGRTLAPLWRLVAAGVGSGVLALVGWAPYLYRVLTSPTGVSGRAQHYLPLEGTELPTHFFAAPLLAILGAVCVIWLIVRSRSGTARALTWGLLASYVWVVLSMLMTVTGTTLLGFRMGLPIAAILGVGGVMAVVDARSVGLRRLYPQVMTPRWAHVTNRVLTVVAVVAALSFVVQIPWHQRDEIDRAYTDVDGDGVRADQFPADDTVYYKDVDAEILAHRPDRTGTVVLSDEQSFMAYYPYHAYQAMTAHYANPLGQFDARNSEIESWTGITDPDRLRAAMDAATADKGWAGPDALVLRGSLTGLDRDGYGRPDPGTTFSYRMADDIYPNNPNVRFRTVAFHAEAFATGWSLREVGPFVVAVRTD